MLDHLTESQRQAVEHSDGPLLILAGAGTGKTRTLTCRIAHLIRKEIVRPNQIMAVTFTRKATHEMSNRLQELLGSPGAVQKIHLGTFHAISSALLRESLSDGIKPTLLPEAGQIDLIKKILQEQDLGSLDWQPLEVLRRISMAKGSLSSPEDVASKDDIRLATVYRLYQRELAENHLLDFDDLIGALLQRWQKAPGVLAGQQRLFRVILVDEFQDVNEAQYRWLKLLAEPHRNLCVVGDTDQSIYGFRGSNVNIFQNFQKDFPESQVVKLEQNFRCSQRIVEAAGGVIAYNTNPLTCNLWSENEPGPLLRLGRLADEDQEAGFLVSEVERLLGGSSHYQIYRGSDVDTPNEPEFGFADFAILYRTHAQNRPLADALSRAGIPYQTVGERAPFATRAADALLSYLHFASDTASIKDLQIVFNLPPRGLGQKAQQWLEEEIARGVGPWEILRQARKNCTLPVRYQAALDRLQRTIVALQDLLVSRPLPEVLERAWQATGLSQHFEQSGPSLAESFRWLLLLSNTYGRKPATETFPIFLEDLSHWRAGDFYDPRADAVTLMTLHAAKGLEFPVVFVCGLDQGLLPFSRQDSKKCDLEEERRLFYVAMTRARHLLVLSTAHRRFLYGQVRTSRPSPFIEEIPAHCLEEVSSPLRRKKKSSNEKQLTLF